MHSLLTGYPSTRSLQRIDIHAAKKNCKLMIENNVLSTCISALVAFTKAYDAHTDVGAVPMVFANCLMYSLGGRNYTSLWISYFYFYCLTHFVFFVLRFLLKSDTGTTWHDEMEGD